jgi:hypothetical protein
VIGAPCDVQPHHPAFNGGPALVIRTNADGAEDFISSEFIRD